MRIDYARWHNSTEVENVYILEFSYYSGLSTKEWSLTVGVEGGKAVEILDGDTVQHGGWYDWDEVGMTQEEILEVVNKIYETVGGIGNETRNS